MSGHPRQSHLSVDAHNSVPTLPARAQPSQLPVTRAVRPNSCSLFVAELRQVPPDEDADGVPVQLPALLHQLDECRGEHVLLGDREQLARPAAGRLLQHLVPDRADRPQGRSAGGAGAYSGGTSGGAGAYSGGGQGGTGTGSIAIHPEKNS